MTTTETLTEAQRAYIDGLRDLTDWLEQHPEYAPTYPAVTLNVFADDKAELAEFARAAGRATKHWLDSWFVVRAEFGPHSIDANLAREQVCDRVVTGIRWVPAQPARTEDVVEWVCQDTSILAPTGVSWDDGGDGS